MQPGLLAVLAALAEPTTRGELVRPLLWVSKSYRHLARGQEAQGQSVYRLFVERVSGHLATRCGSTPRSGKAMSIPTATGTSPILMGGWRLFALSGRQ